MVEIFYNAHNLPVLAERVHDADAGWQWRTGIGKVAVILDNFISKGHIANVGLVA